jgi:hypothetical protein
MILAALSEELRALFGRHAQARVVLWFDEKREFERLLPAFEKHLSGQSAPPFTLLRYDEEAGHGQLWIKHEIHWARRSLPAAEREARRCVLYLPFPAERLDGPEEEGGFSADLLLEYRYLGATWLVDGKKPSLFAFLRRAGVKLPSDPKEQRLLMGGRPRLPAREVRRPLRRARRGLLGARAHPGLGPAAGDRRRRADRPRPRLRAGRNGSSSSVVTVSALSSERRCGMPSESS